jgi:hypothetical protein
MKLSAKTFFVWHVATCGGVRWKRNNIKKSKWLAMLDRMIQGAIGRYGITGHPQITTLINFRLMNSLLRTSLR